MTEAKFRAGDKVVLISQYPDGSSPELFNTGELILGREYYVEGTFLIPFKWCPSGWSVDLVGCGYCVDQDMLVLAEDHDRDASVENITLTIRKEDDIVEILGKKYNKAAVMAAIKNFEIVE